MSKNRIIFFFSLLIFFFACKKDDDRVPYHPVDFYIYLSDPQFTELNIYYKPVMVTGGVNGIVIYRKSAEEFVALDRTCTYKPSENCAVEPDTTELFLICPCCNSKFTLPGDGGIEEGDAERPLVQYQATFDGTKVHVYN